jgi:hypothetical protein
MSGNLIAQVFDLGKDVYGRRVVATRKRTYDGKSTWEIVTARVGRAVPVERTSGLSDENILALKVAMEAKG